MFSFFYQHETEKPPLPKSNSLLLGHIACRAGRFRGLGDRPPFPPQGVDFHRGPDRA